MDTDVSSNTTQDVKLMFFFKDEEKNITNWTKYHFEEYVFDRTDVRAIFITLYTAVFCCCFFGNLLVILVVTLSRRLRSITNFFLANLAVADMCVGVFCVFQNLSIYLIPSWVFGDFLCKMYQFIHSLSYTASIIILVVICVERYLAIIYPIQCKQMLTSTRLRFVVAGAWIMSAAYSAPKFVFVQTITNNIADGPTETICISDRQKYNSELFDIINFVLLYVIPLGAMMILYSRIALCLWQSSRGLQNIGKPTCPGSQCPRLYQKPSPDTKTFTGDSEVSVADDKGALATPVIPPLPTPRKQRSHSRNCNLSHLSRNVLRARRGVIRMLIVVVLTFAICNLPYHARKLWQYWSVGYQGSSTFSTLLTPLTFLLTYFNSGINPLLYAFMSKNFRRGMRELIMCNYKGTQRKNEKMVLLNQIGVGPSVLRRSSTRSTRANCSTLTVQVNGSDT